VAFDITALLQLLANGGKVADAGVGRFRYRDS
jgi:hypothetical protein